MKKIISMIGLGGVLCILLFFFPSCAHTVTTVAGTGSHGASDYGLGQFNLPGGVLSGDNGYFYVLDTYNNLIRIVSPEGEISRLSGNIQMDGDMPILDSFRFPMGGFKDGPLDEALFNRPTAGVRDALGRIFITDSANHAIRMISMGMVYTFAGGTGEGHKDGHGAYAQFSYPTALAISPDGSLYIADTGNNAIRRICAAGYVTTVAGFQSIEVQDIDFQGIEAHDIDFQDSELQDSELLDSELQDSELQDIYEHNNSTYHSILLNEPMGIAVREDGVIFVADTGNHVIRIIENGRISTFAGVYRMPEEIGYETDDETSDETNEETGNNEWDLHWDLHPIGGFADGPPETAMFNMPIGLTFWGEILIVADYINHAIRKIHPCGEVETLTGTGYPGHADGCANEAMFHLPRGVYIIEDALIIADTGNNMIRKIILNTHSNTIREILAGEENEND